MPFRIERVAFLTSFNLSTLDVSFDISAVVAKPYDKSLAQESILTTPSPPRTKTYPHEPSEPREPSTEHLVLLALDDANRVGGYLKASKAWNGLVSLDDIAIHRPARRNGIARQLITELKSWTRELGLPAICAETQNTNVSACAFYRASGFKFGGYDEYLYHGIEGTRDEVALYWYWFSDEV